jgi:uncharacterized lipoprotein YmbA
MMVAQSAPNSLTISAQNRWGAPLEEMLRGVLTQDLAQRLPREYPDNTVQAGTRMIAVDVLRFQREPSGTVVLEGSWSASTAGSDDQGSLHSVSRQMPAVSDDAGAQAAQRVD